MQLGLKLNRRRRSDRILETVMTTHRCMFCVLQVFGKNVAWWQGFFSFRKIFIFKLIMPWGKCWVVLIVWNCIRIRCKTQFIKYNTTYINIHFYKFATPCLYFRFLLSIYTIAVLLNKKSGSCLTSNCSHFKNSHKRTHRQAGEQREL